MSPNKRTFIAVASDQPGEAYSLGFFLDGVLTRDIIGRFSKTFSAGFKRRATFFLEMRTRICRLVYIGSSN